MFVSYQKYSIYLYFTLITVSTAHEMRMACLDFTHSVNNTFIKYTKFTPESLLLLS